MYIGHPSECFNVTGLGSVKLFLLNYLFIISILDNDITHPVISASALTC
jgi:hypothetical protein